MKKKEVYTYMGTPCWVYSLWFNSKEENNARSKSKIR